MKSWEKTYENGNLSETQRRFFEAKPPEELYRISEDPHTVDNLAGDPAYQEELRRLRKINNEFILENKDLGFIPEGLVNSLRGDRSLYEAIRDDNIPIEAIIKTADMASRGEREDLDKLARRLNHDDPSVRYWAAMGLAIAGEEAGAYEEQLLERAEDPVGAVRVAVAEALLAVGRPSRALELVDQALQAPNDHVKLQALNLLEAEQPDRIPAALMRRIRALEAAYEDADGAGGYVFRAASRLGEARAN